jgi:hypothetical protein
MAKVRKTKIIICEYCKKPKETRKDSPARFCSVSCSRKIRKGLAEGNERVSHAGYIEVYTPFHPRARKNGYVFKHILVMEKELGRYISIEEEIHHKDENKQNNDPSNLEIIDKVKHAKITADSRWKENRKANKTKCSFCEKVIFRKPSKRKKDSFCSQSCFGKWTFKNRKGVFKNVK